jgi:hypothetical protein
MWRSCPENVLTSEPSSGVGRGAVRRESDRPHPTVVRLERGLLARREFESLHGLILGRREYVSLLRIKAAGDEWAIVLVIRGDVRELWIRDNNGSIGQERWHGGISRREGAGRMAAS